MIEAQILENHKIMISKNAISDSVKYETIKFSFPKAWGSYAKTAVFKNEEKTVSVILEDGNPLYLGENECYIPHEVLTFPGFSVSVFGNEGDSLATTARGFVTVLQSGYEQGDSPQEPTPDEYSQLLAVMNETKDIAQSVRDDADNGAFKGDKGDTGPQGETGAKGPQGEKGDKGDKGEDADISLFANVIKNSKSGSAVTIDDISPVEHNLDIKLTSEKGMVNVFDISKLTSNENMQVNAQSGTVIVSQHTKTEKSLGEICPRLKAGDEVMLKYTTIFENSWIGFYTGMVDGVGTTSSPDGTYLHYSTLLVSDYMLTLPIEFYPDGTETYSNIQFLISGDLITDFSNVNISRYGKNLFDINNTTAVWGASYEVDLLENSITIKQTGMGSWQSTYFKLSPRLSGKKVTASAKVKTSGVNTGGIRAFSVKQNSGIPTATINGVYGITSPDGFTVISFTDVLPTLNEGENLTLNLYSHTSGSTLENGVEYTTIYKDIQIEISDTATRYEPYKEPQTAMASIDGTVNNITSLCPITTLITDTEGVIINANYNADTKKYIDNKFAELSSVMLNSE